MCLCTIIKDASCLLCLMATSVQMPLFMIILLGPSLDIMLFQTKQNISGFTVRLAGPKLLNAINTDVCGKLSLTAFKTAYKKISLLAFIIDVSNYGAVIVCILFFSLQPGFG